MLIEHGGHGTHPFGTRPDWIGWLTLAALAAGMWLLMPAGSAGVAPVDIEAAAALLPAT